MSTDDGPVPSYRPGTLVILDDGPELLGTVTHAGADHPDHPVTVEVVVPAARVRPAAPEDLDPSTG